MFRADFIDSQKKAEGFYEAMAVFDPGLHVYAVRPL
jgi:hypothetical protein